MACDSNGAATDNFHDQRHTKAVFWEASGYNNLGEPTVESPVEMDVRIERELEDVLDTRGNRISTSHQLFVDRDVTIGSLIWIGEKCNLPSPVPELFQVVDFVKIPSVDGTLYDRCAKLIRYSDGEPILTAQ